MHSLTMLGGLLSAAFTVPAALSSAVIEARADNVTFSKNVTSCPGYTLLNTNETANGLTASLGLAGSACNAFGSDIANLTVQVIYETDQRLHVHIFDTANKQFIIPESTVARPSASDSTSANTSDLVFNYTSSPFAFWVSRKDDPTGVPLFDTRTASLPQAPVQANAAGAMEDFDSFNMVFEDQYLQMTSALPTDTNVYGLGEVISSSGFRRALGNNGTNGTVQTNWARDVGDPVDENMYGIHPFYMEHRYDSSTQQSSSHGVFMMNSAGADIILATPESSNTSFIQYRFLGGTMDLYFLSGPDPKSVIEQYGSTIGTSTLPPAWAFGFHLSRWGYTGVNDTKAQVTAMREAGIPLEVMWNDIDVYQAYRDFTLDEVNFKPEEMANFTGGLNATYQHYIPIVDVGIAVLTNDTDVYDTYTKGLEQDVYVKNPDGSTFVGQVWPGYTAWPDFHANNTQSWWTEAFKNWTDLGVKWSGIWLDMNEASNFCTGSCGSQPGADIANTSTPFALPGQPGAMVTAYPECYDVDKLGNSGNMTVNGTSTYNCTSSDILPNPNAPPSSSSLVKRAALGVKDQNISDSSILDPPYAIANGYGPLGTKTLSPNTTYAPGFTDYDAHNLYGLSEEIATYNMMKTLYPERRPFIISRSTFASAGKWTNHWLGDNYSLWSYLYYSIQGILQFQMFQIPMVGADTCGFNGNTDEELCNRWMQLSALIAPFFRNHNTKTALSQEPYRWPSVANASISAISTRYSLLPYWYTLFSQASLSGTPPVRALFYEFPTDPATFSIDRQVLVGPSILVTPVLTPNTSSVRGYFPGSGNGSSVWRDFYTHEVLNTTGGYANLSAPLGTIPVHIRSGSAILMHDQPAYTTYETRQGPYSLLVSLDSTGSANGTAYVDDGVSPPPISNTTLTMAATNGTSVTITPSGSYNISQQLNRVTILGAMNPANLTAGGNVVNFTYDATKESILIPNASLSLSSPVMIQWTIGNAN